MILALPLLLLCTAPAKAADCAGSLLVSCDPAFFLDCSSSCWNSPASNGGTVYVKPLTSGCTWTAVPTVPWVHITSVDTLSNPQRFTFTTDANTDPLPRSGLIAVSGKSYTVRQGGTSTNVSGRVTTSGGAGVSGVTISFSAFASPVLTDATGFWQQSGFPTCTFAIATPSKSGFTFSPTRRSVSSGQTNRDFTAIP